MKKGMITFSRSMIVLGFAMLSAILPSAANAGMGDYCTTPPFLNNSNVSPDIMIMLDSSGSMNEAPLLEADFDPTQFANGHYYGYFDTNYMYKYDSTNHVWRKFTDPIPSNYYDTGDVDAQRNPIASGDLLNWVSMRKIELAKKILVGGNPGVVSYPSGTLNPRTVTAPNTIKLYTEDPYQYSSYGRGLDPISSPAFDNTSVSSSMTVTGYDNVIYPFKGNFTYNLNSHGCTTAPAPTNPCSYFTLSPVTLSNTIKVQPSSNNSVGSHWAVYPASTSAYADVDDTTQDGDSTYIQNTTDTSGTPAIFNYAAVTPLAGTISNVQVYAYAERAGSCSRKTAKLQGVFLMTGGTVTVGPASASLGSRYSGYTLNTPMSAKNPKTGAAWTWDDILGGSGSPSSSQLIGFGVQNSDTSSTCYPRVTQVYLIITVANPASGRFDLVVDTDKQTIVGDGLIDQFAGGSGSQGVRFGFSQYGANGSDGATVLNPVDFSNSSQIISTVATRRPDGSTPLAEAEYELVRYYSQLAPKWSQTPVDYTVSSGPTSTTTKYWDPYYYGYSKIGSALDRYVYCATKSYILLITDGEPTADSYSSPYPFGSSTLAIPSATNDSNGLSEIALWARTNDVRPGSCTGIAGPWSPMTCIPTTQNVYTYTVFLFGRGSTLLQNTAVNGAFNGSPVGGKPPCKNTAPNHPTQDELKDCYLPNMSDGSVWLITSPTDTTDPITGLPITVDPPTPIGYYEGSDAYQLQTSLSQAISDILKRAASGTSVSVLTTSSRGVGSMLQAYFLPSRQDQTRSVTWTGYTQNLWLDPFDNLREDTVNDEKLELDKDNVLKIFYDSTNNMTMASMFTTDAAGYGDPDVSGSLGSCTPDYTKEFTSVNYLWEAGLKLATKRPSQRNIFTSSTVVRDGATAFSFSDDDFDWTSNIQTNASMISALTPSGSTLTAEQIVGYIRGECRETGVTGDTACAASANSTFRDRRITQKAPGIPIPGGDTNGNVWKLGDIITSTPKVFANTQLNAYDQVYGDTTYASYIRSTNYTQRSSIAFVGANDGMLHAFRVGYLKDHDDGSGALDSGVQALFKNTFTSSDGQTDELGDEVWAYIPFNAFPYLQYLADPLYCHMYFNDLPVTLVDVSINGTATDVKTQSSWRTILIGGMRYGGACSNGIQPANPPAGSSSTVGFSSLYAIDITNPESPVPLWEFSDTDMGYATSYPAILRTGDSKNNGYWYVAFGSGSTRQPKTAQDLNRTTPGYVYVLDLRTGQRVKKIQLDHNAIVGDVLAVDANLDSKTERIYFGTSYLDTVWKGKLESINIPNQDLSTAWTPTVQNLLYGNFPFTATPAATVDSKGVIWVFAGSGKYEADVDQIDSSQQVFFGFKDLLGSGVTTTVTYPLTISSLDNRTSSSMTGTVNGTTQACMYSQSTQTWQVETMVTSISTANSVAASSLGWYINLGLESSPTLTGERVISKPLAIGGMVDYLTFVPNPDVCSGGGTSYLCSVAFDTGIAPSVVSILSQDVTRGATSGNVTVQKCVSLGSGAPPKNEAIIIPPISNKPPPPVPPGKRKPPANESSGTEKLTKMIQVSTGAIIKIVDNPPISVTSKIFQWLKK